MLLEDVAGPLGNRVQGSAITRLEAAYSPACRTLATAATERLLRAIPRGAGLASF